MKSLFTGLFTFIFFYFSVAQITFDPNVILLESDGTDNNDYILVKISNTGSEPVSVHWMFEKGENFPEEWDIIITDDNLDYVPNHFKNAPVLPNNIAANDSIDYYIRIFPNNTAGSTYCILHLYEDADCENEIATSSPPTTSIHIELLEQMILYPNPTSDYVGIMNDDKVNSVEVVNSVGQTVIKREHQNNELHPVSDLPNGIYHMILRNENFDIIRILNFSKN